MSKTMNTSGIGCGMACLLLALLLALVPLHKGQAAISQEEAKEQAYAILKAELQLEPEDVRFNQAVLNRENGRWGLSFFRKEHISVRMDAYSVSF